MNNVRILRPPLSTDASEAPSPSLHGVFRRAVAELARRCTARTTDPRESYLARSINHEDLENRARSWEAYEARRRLLPPAL
jgi:hypothetical protein